MTATSVSVFDLDAHDDAARRGAAWGELRRLAGDVLGRDAREVPIRRGRNGKPEIDGIGLHAAVSLHGSCCAVAISDAGPVGVHVAPVRAHPPVEALLAVLPSAVRSDAPAAVGGTAFALWWAGVQAAVKAHGAGLDEASACLAATCQEAVACGPDVCGPDVCGPDVAVGVACRAFAPVSWRGRLAPTAVAS